MKTPSDSLFKLIKSMTMSEKRYFKIYSSRHQLKKGNSYVTLFNAIEKQNNYDEKLILKQFKNKGIFNRLDLVKGHLHKMILASLKFYNSNSTFNFELRRPLAK